VTSSDLLVFGDSAKELDSASPAPNSVFSAIVDKPAVDLARELAALNPDHAASIKSLLADAAPVGTPPSVSDAGESPLLFAVRQLPAFTTRLKGALPQAATGLAAERQVGPLLTTQGIPVWIDAFRRIRQLRFVRAPGGAPIFALPLRQIAFAGGRGKAKAPAEFELAAGSIWFATGLFAAAPAGVYSGIRIMGGRVRFSIRPDLSGDEVVLPPAISCEFELELDPPTGGADARNDLAASAFVPPMRLAVSIRPADATIQALDDGEMAVYGAKLTLASAVSPARYVAALNRLAIPLAANQADLAIGRVKSAVFVPDGQAPITSAALALPAATIDPANLGDASGVGAFLLELDAGLSARWRGQSRAVPLGRVELMLDADRLAVSASVARAEGTPARFRIGSDGDVGSAEFVRPEGSAALFLSQSNGDEILAIGARAAIRLRRPLDVAGQPVTAELPSAVVMFIDNGATERVIIEGLTDKIGSPAAMAFAVTNAVLRTSPPLACLIGGEVQGDALSVGFAVTAFGLIAVRPSLPDPYAANFGTGRGERGKGGGMLLAAVRFDAAGTRLDFTLPQSIQLDADRAPPVSVPVPRGLLTRFAATDLASQAIASDPAFGFERSANVILVDVSTAASRFGIALRPPTRISRDQNAGATPFKPATIRELHLSVDGRLITLLTLPAVQWEPVRNVPGPEPFPDEVRFLNSGVPTVVDVPGVDLVPMTPIDAYDAITANFAGAAPKPSAARFTLPFGMVADSRLTNPGPGGRGALVGEARPTAGDMVGAHQLRIDAADPALPPDETPALPGTTLQLPVAEPAGGGGAVSILGTSVTTIFDAYLGPGSPNALVPVTRIDLSGFGESLFSHWANPLDAETQVSKAEFQVVNGRAGREVVQVQSVMAPGAVPVVRTITVERKGNAVFTRYDSGWVAVRDGEYHYSSGSPVVSHPGVVERFTRVTNIRETGAPISVNGWQFTAVYYDCDLIIDGAPAPVPARRQLGYVKLDTVDLDVATYAALIEEVGPMGGPIDVTIGIGRGPQRMRLRRIGIGVAGSEFAMAAWGSLIFPGGGDWSVLEVDDAAGTPAPIAEDLGLPIIRQGAAGTPSSAPYRFADPEDLFQAAAPLRDYGILHSMGTQRAFFRRPRIEVATPARIVSTERPVIADPLLLATSVGPFPRQDDAIPYPSNAFALEVRPDGSYRLDGPASFPANVPRRTIGSAGTVRSDLDYSGSTVTYTVDTAAPQPWQFKLYRATKILANTSLGDVFTMVADIAGEAGRETEFGNPTTKLGGPFDIVQDLLTIMQDLGISAKPDVRMTNDWSLKVALAVPFVDASGEPFKVVPGEPLPTIIFDDTGVTVEINVAPENDEASFELGGKPMFAIKSVPGLYVVAIVQFTLTLSESDGTTYVLLIGVGVAYELDAGPFTLHGLFAITFFGIFGDTVLGYGVGFLVQVSASIEPIVSIELSLEGNLARLLVDQHTATETVFQVAKLTFAIEVSIFLVFSISLEVETRKVEVIRGPLLENDCPDVVP
jgi:hypothetical protein